MHARSDWKANSLSAARITELENLPGWQWHVRERNAKTDDSQSMPNTADEDCVEYCFEHASCPQKGSESFGTSDNRNADRAYCKQCKTSFKISAGGKQWTRAREFGKVKYSDSCPSCKQTIYFTKANADDLNHEHSNGKGDKCRFRGKVVDGKINANMVKTATKKCFKCGNSKAEEKYHKDEWNKVGKNANRRKCKQCL